MAQISETPADKAGATRDSCGGSTRNLNSADVLSGQILALSPITYKGHVYRLVDVVQHILSDRRRIWAQVWSTNCTVCGQAIEFRRAANASRFMPVRSCEKHSAPASWTTEQ